MKMKINDLVSIVITTHKGSNSVGYAVESVLSQDYSPVEIIVVDDNGLGTEEQIATEKALHEYIQAGKITYHPHEVNKNGSAARNTGVALANGKYIGLLDDDDRYFPEKIAKSIARLSELSQEWGGVYTDVEIDYGERGRYVNRYHKEGLLVFEMLTHIIFMNPSVLIMRKEAYDAINGYDESFARHQDWEFNARFFDKYMIAHVGIVGSVYNCQIKRHFNPIKAQEYRAYYMSKMKPIISKLPEGKQRIVYLRNAIELCGLSVGKYAACKELVNAWQGKADPFTFIVAMLVTVCERIKAKLNKAK